ncbi:MAG: hypothetical protein R3C05_28515 [Pirellulaceae bacterium]
MFRKFKLWKREPAAMEDDSCRSVQDQHAAKKVTAGSGAEVDEESSDRFHHIDAVHFVHHAIKHAMRDQQTQQNGMILGEGLCRVVLELAVDEFGAEGADVLKQWNIADSSDIQLIVDRMRKADVDEAQRVDIDSDFTGWFDLQQPAESWRLKW